MVIAPENEICFLPAGEGALVVEFGDAIDRTLSDRVLTLAAALGDVDGVRETVPTFRSLLVQYDPLRARARDLQSVILERLAHAGSSDRQARRWRLPACYADPDLAPDLAEVADRAKMSPDDVVRLHAGTPFHVYVVGFLPGFAYLGDLPPALALPRRSDPRVRVPPGSVGIALGLTGVYPLESPGGWHLIANCPLRFFDAEATDPSLLAPGDEVYFEPVSRAEFDATKDAVARGAYRAVPELRA